MDTPAEESEVTSTSETHTPAYSPHTYGFPPTSQSIGVSNPFAVKKMGTNQLKGSVQSTSGPSSCVLRPSKLEAGLGSTIFTTKSVEHSPKEKPAEEVTNKTYEEPAGSEDLVKTTSKNKEEEATVDSTEAEATELLKDEESVKDKDEMKPDSNQVPESETPLPSTSSNSGEEAKKDTLSYNQTPMGFVFGSNLNDRVANFKGVSNGDGTSEVKASSSTSICSDPSKRKWEGTSVTTGEEDESNVMQTSCRLFTFDVGNSSWIERGRGQLRLNDRKESDVLHSRLIVRTKGSLRVMLNTPVFPEMIVEKSNEKCIKITGREDGAISVKVFLIQCSNADAETLHSALEWRVRALASTAGTPGTQESSKITIHQGHFESTSPPKKQKLSE